MLDNLSIIFQSATISWSIERDTRDAVAFGEQLFLDLDVASDAVRRTQALMIKIGAARKRQRVFAGGEPRLGPISLPKIVRGIRPPIFVGTQPGSSALDLTSFQRRAKANASKMSQSLLSA